MKHWENISLDNIVEEFNGVLYIEEWLDVIGYEGYYQISNLGRVKSLAKVWSNGRKPDTIAKQGGARTKDGYLNVTFCVDKIKKTESIHVLVAKHFVSNPNNYSVVNHKGGDKKDNRFFMLEWTTHQGNTVHAFDNGLRLGRKGEAHHNTKLTEKDVRRIKSLYFSGNKSQKEIGEVVGVCQTQIGRIIRGERWKHIF